MVNEQAAGLVFEEGDAPAVSVMIGGAATRREAGERERDVRWRGAVHSEKLAHVADAEPMRMPRYGQPVTMMISKHITAPGASNS